MQDLTELPPELRSGLVNYLGPGEEILFALRSFRAVYKPPKWIDSNTFFNSWFILTNERIIIARNSSSFKKFRDIFLNEIRRIDYETGALESKLTIESPDTVDTIEFFREVREYAQGLREKVKEALENARRTKEYTMASGLMTCSKCGGEVPKTSKFCPECGEKQDA